MAHPVRHLLLSLPVCLVLDSTWWKKRTDSCKLFCDDLHVCVSQKVNENVTLKKVLRGQIEISTFSAMPVALQAAGFDSKDVWQVSSSSKAARSQAIKL